MPTSPLTELCQGEYGRHKPTPPLLRVTSEDPDGCCGGGSSLATGQLQSRRVRARRGGTSSGRFQLVPDSRPSTKDDGQQRRLSPTAEENAGSFQRRGMNEFFAHLRRPNATALPSSPSQVDEVSRVIRSHHD